MKIKKITKVSIICTMLLAGLPMNKVYAINDGIVDISAISDVSWCGNIPGFGTYPQRALKTVTLEYSDVVDESNLDESDFIVEDLDYSGDETKLIVEDVKVSGKNVILDVDTKSSAGILVSSNGNFRKYISHFKVTQNDDVKNKEGEELSASGSTKEFDQSKITNYASDEFKDLVIDSENSNNKIYVKYYLPENYDSKKKYPMVVHHTGGGQHYRTDTPDATKYGENNYGVELDIDLTPRTFSVEAPEDTIMVTIQCLANNKPENYSPGKDINQIVKYFMDNYAVDIDRIYAVGNSQGGLDLSEAVYLHPEYYAAYLPCNTSIIMGDKSSTDTEAYKKTVEYCQAYVDNEVAIWFHRGENDFTGAYSEVTIPYDILVQQYKNNGYSDEQISKLVKQTKYLDQDFKDVGSTYYHGATGLMCLNSNAINWVYQQTRETETQSIVKKYNPTDRDGNSQITTSAFIYDATSKMDENTESVTNTPTYLIYPDHKLNEMGATNLLKELGIVSHLDKYATKAIIVNPLNEEYTTEDDNEWLKVIDTLVATNVKVIGIGNGATFVNQYVSQKDWAVAGIMTYGGQKGEEAKYSVPTYVSNSSSDVVNDYVKANSATKESEKAGLTTYVNSKNDYERVVSSTNEETLATAFQNAWENIFSKNGRIGNIGGTFYAMPMSQERDFEYTSFIDIAREGFTRNVVKYDLNGNGKDNLWYEYLTQNTINASKGSVPVVIMLHGNGNDPRTQFETNGFAKVAKENNIILIEPEWQGTLLNGKFEAMTTDDSSSEQNDIITMIEYLKKKYPQIDASRIYVEGLSRGGLNSVNIGLTQSNVFAAIGTHSCGTKGEFYEILENAVSTNKDNIDMPFYFVAGSKDHFIPITDYGESSQVLKTIQLYQKLNGINETSYSDLSEQNNKYFGMKLDNYGTIENRGLCNIVGGTLSNDKGVMMSLNAVEDWGHWNYEPTAQLMWEFFSHYSRVDGTLYIDNVSTNPTKPSETPTDTKKPDSTNTKVTTTTNKKNHKVKTGDNTEITALVGMMVLAGGTICMVRRKKHD